MTLSAAQKSYLRDDHPHTVRQFMSVFVPTVVYVGQVTGSPSRGDRQITVSDVSGNLANAIANQTIFVGTTSGDDDVSRRRFRSRSGQVITMDENSVVWANGQYITIVEFWELWPVFPYIDTTAPFTFYKDRDVVYSDQNSSIPPRAIIKGNHLAGMLDGPSISFPLDGTDSVAVADSATISTYAWSATAGTIANASASSTTITFTSANPAGEWVFLTITDSNGKTHTTRRAIFVCERSGANTPYVDFAYTTAPTTDWGQGGGYTSVQVFGDADVTQFPDKSLVVIWAENYYGGTIRTFDNIGNVVLSGYIRSDTVHKNVETGVVTFEIKTLDGIMANKKAFSVSLTDVTSTPDTWWKMSNLTFTKGVDHLWRWHSTLFEITNVYLPTHTARVEAIDDFVEGDLFSIVDSFASQHGIFAHACCNRAGEVYVEIDYNMLNDSARAAVETIMEIDPKDMRGDPVYVLVRTQEKQYSYAMLDGMIWDGTTRTPIIAKAPGEVPETEGPGELSLKRIILASQTEANERVGRALAVVNNPFQEVPIKFAGNYSFIDVVPQKVYTLDVQVQDTKRGLRLVNMRMVPRTVVNEYDSAAGTVFTNVVFAVDASGNDGIPGNFPTTPPTDPPPPSLGTLAQLAAFNDTDGFYARGSWTEYNGGMTGTNIQQLHGGADPFWRSKQVSLDPADAIVFSCVDGKIFRSTDRGVSWTDVTPATGPDSYSPANFQYIWYEGNKYVNQQHVFLARYSDAGTWVSYILLTEDDGSTWTWKSLNTIASTTITEVNAKSTGRADVSFFVKSIVVLDINNAIVPHNDARYLYWYDIDGSFAITTAGEAEVDPTDGGTFKNDASLSKISATRAIFAWRQTTVSKYGRVCTADINGSLTINTITNFETGTEPSNLAVVGLDTDKALLVYVYDSSGAGTTYQYDVLSLSIDASGNVTVSNTTTPETSGTLDWTDFAWAKIDTNTAMLTYVSGGKLYARHVTHTSLSVGGSQELVSSGSYNVNGHSDKSLVLLGSNLFVAGYDTSTNDLGLVAFTYSGGSYSVGTPVLLGTTAQEISIAKVSDSLIGMVYTRTLLIGDAYVRSVSVSGTTLTINSDEIQLTSTVHTFLTPACEGLGDGNHITAVYARSSNGQVRVFTIGFAPIYATFKVNGMAIADGAGLAVYITGSDNTNLYVEEYTLPGLSLTQSTSLGAGTIAQQDAGTWTAFPRPSRTGVSDLECFVIGRMNDPFSLGTVHIIYTNDAFSTASIIENSWGSDYCSAFYEADDGYMVAIRDRGSTSELWRGLSVLIKKRGIQFPIHPGALLVTSDGYIVIGAANVGWNVMVAYMALPYSAWTDITEDYPTTGGVVGLVIL